MAIASILTPPRAEHFASRRGYAEPAPDKVASLLRNHDHWRIDVATDEVGHDGRVDDT